MIAGSRSNGIAGFHQSCRIWQSSGPNRGEIDATLHGELGTILGWIEAQALGKYAFGQDPGRCD
jgi:hypothetical protein